MGVQKNIPKLAIDKSDATTIQGILESGLKKFNCDVLPSVSISSRTDSGVHALNSTAHVDLLKKDNTVYDCDRITATLNRNLAKDEYSIRILNTRLVPQDFHARFNAVSRTYLYRIAVLKDGILNNGSKIDFLKNCINIPIEELNRCVFIFDPKFDVCAFREAASHIVGLHDFRTFMATPRNISKKVSTIRILSEINIKSSRSLALPYSDSAGAFNYWDITFKAKSFLYRQVRRTIGVLLAVAQGRLCVRDVQIMLQVPSGNSWDPRVRCQPPHGLYLCNVEYRPQDLVVTNDCNIK